MIQLELETSLGKAEQIILCVTFLFKGMTLNKKMRLDYESLRLPETSIFKWNGYMPKRNLNANSRNENSLTECHNALLLNIAKVNAPK